MANNMYYSILTTVGTEKLAQAIITEIPVKITTMAVGDGNGQFYSPTPDQAQLKRETWRGEINDLRSAEDAANHVLAEGVVPADVGGWTVREVGLFDDTGDLIAVCNYPDTIKPLPTSGSGKQLYIQIILVIDNIAALELIIDGNIATASRYYVDTLDKKHRDELASNDGANYIFWQNESVGEVIDGIERGHCWPSYHTTREVTGNLLSGTNVINQQKYVLPNGNYSATRIFRNRSTGTSYGDFVLKGQGSSTRINHPASSGAGDQIYADNLKRAYIGKMSLINDDLGKGGDTSGTTNNGQIWLRYCEDVHVDDVFFSGGDVLTFCLDQCYNTFATNLKVDHQIRFPSGYSKSPLIVGDFSEKCMFIQGYAKSVSRNGAIYAGDLADNDQANDSVFAFINLIGLPYSVRANGNAAMWQEGQLSVSNARLIGVNLFGNGIGHGISEKALGTDIGVVYRGHQVRGIWNLNKFTSIGGQFFDNIGENISAAPTIKAAIHHDNGVMTSSIGGIFENNIRDFSDYSGGKAKAGSAVQSNGDILTSSFYVPGIGTTGVHHGISNGVMTETASIAISGNKSHTVVINESIAGYIGSFGYSNIEVTTVADFIGITAQAGSHTGAMITQIGYGFINCYHSVFRDYLSILEYSHGGYVLFDNCVFVNVTFSDADLRSAKYINCKFSNCINAPDIKGFNIGAGSPSHPASFSTEVTLNAGEAYTFPAWTHEGRGVYSVKVGGRREDVPYGEYRTYKKFAVSNGVVDELVVSSSGDFAVTWPPDGFITITPRVAGRYLIRVS